MFNNRNVALGARSIGLLTLWLGISGCGLWGKKETPPWDEMNAQIAAIKGAIEEVKASTVSSESESTLPVQVSAIQGRVDVIGAALGVPKPEPEARGSPDDKAEKASVMSPATTGSAIADDVRKIVAWLPGVEGTRLPEEPRRLAVKREQPEWWDRLVQSLYSNLLLLPFMAVAIVILFMAGKKMQTLSGAVSTTERHLKAMREAMGIPTNK